MEAKQTTGSHPGLSQASAVSAQLSLGTKGAPQTVLFSRFNGVGVRYKAKLIGVDPVPDAHGDKMCWDSMMKLKGCEAAARRQGKHKLRVWLNVSSSGLKILDERTGALLYDHDRGRISSLRKDDSDPRALAYVYETQDGYSLFYIKMANLAGPVLADIDVVCQGVNLETHEEPSEEPTQTGSLLLLDNVPGPPVEGSVLEEKVSAQPPTEQPNQVSPSCELMEVFTIPMPSQSFCDNQPIQPVSMQPTFSNSQILSIFPQHPVGGTPYSPPPYPPTAMAWAQQGLLANRWPSPAIAARPTLPTGLWGNSGVQPEAQGRHPGVMNGGITPHTSALNVSGNPAHIHPPNTGPDLLQ